MEPSELLAAIEDEIARLNEARALLAGSGPGAAHRRVLARAVYGGPALRNPDDQRGRQGSHRGRSEGSGPPSRGQASQVPTAEASTS